MNKILELKKSWLIIAIVIVIVIALILLFSNMHNTPLKSVVDFGGVYKMDNTYIRIYQLDEKNLNFIIEGAIIIYGNALIDNNVAKKTINENYYNFSKTNDGLKFDTNNSILLNGEYKKISNIEINDYYEHYFGNPELLSNENSGIYQSDNITMYLFQTMTNEYQAYIKDNSMNLYVSCIISNDKSLYTSWDNNLVAIEFINGKA